MRDTYNISRIWIAHENLVSKVGRIKKELVKNILYQEYTGGSLRNMRYINVSATPGASYLEVS